MTQIAIAPINMNTSLLKIGTDNYEKTVSSAVLSPTTPMATFKGISGDTTTAAGVPAWKLKLTYAQDWATTNSLSQYLIANLGLTKSVDLTPASGGKKATVSIIIVAGDMGGQVDSVTDATVEFLVIGQPVFA